MIIYIHIYIVYVDYVAYVVDVVVVVYVVVDVVVAGSHDPWAQDRFPDAPAHLAVRSFGAF